MPDIFRAEVVEQRPLTSVVRHVVLRLEEPDALVFRPGQFLQFVLDERTFRVFSIASPPSRRPLVELCVDISPMGKGSRYIAGLRQGDRLVFRGPFGVFTLPMGGVPLRIRGANPKGTPGEVRPLEFVATGAGIAPIRSMLLDLLERGTPLPQGMTLTFGNRTAADILYHEEWMRLARQDNNFQYVPTLSQPAAEWTGVRGYVTDVLLERRSELAGRAFFVCGGREMVRDVRQVLAECGVPEQDAHAEQFI